MTAMPRPSSRVSEVSYIVLCSLRLHDKSQDEGCDKLRKKQKVLERRQVVFDLEIKLLNIIETKLNAELAVAS